MIDHGSINTVLKSHYKNKLKSDDHFESKLQFVEIIIYSFLLSFMLRL